MFDPEVRSYHLSEEQEEFRQVVRKLALDKIRPRAAEIDRTGEYPYDILDMFRKNDLMGLGVPEEYGGSGADLLTFSVVVEELARIDASCSLIPAAQELALVPILLSGTSEQKQQYLPRLASGEWIGAFALTEPDAGSDTTAISTTAIRDGDEYVLNGAKCFITNGGVAHVYTVVATTNPGRGARGLSTFIVEASWPGFEVGKIEDKMGIRGSKTAEIILNDCRVPAGNLLGREGSGLLLAMDTLDRTRPGVGAQAVGIAQGALDEAISYVKERKQFGKALSSQQGVQFILADMATKVEAARHLVYRAASVVDVESRQRQRLSHQTSRISAMAKTFASDVAMEVATDAVQLLGGYGYMRDYPVERMMRDAKVTQIYEGTNQIQRLVIARSLIKE